MESMLIVVTIVSLGLAVTMSVVAWTLIHSERQRAAARIEALEALAFDRGEDECDVESASVSREEPRLDTPPDMKDRLAPASVPAAPTPAWDLAIRDTAPSGTLFESEQPTGAAARRWLAIAAVGLLIAAGYVTASALRSPEVVAAIAASNPDPKSHPLELLSLKHAVESDGTFLVTGFVQNPPNGADLTRVEAVVYLFDHQDQYFATGRAPLDVAAIRAGEESPFVVRIPNVSGVNRYRIGFRRAEGIVAHVDRRGRLPEGTTGETLPEPEVTQPAGGLR